VDLRLSRKTRVTDYSVGYIRQWTSLQNLEITFETKSDLTNVVEALGQLNSLESLTVTNMPDIPTNSFFGDGVQLRILDERSAADIPQGSEDSNVKTPSRDFPDVQLS